MDAKHMNTYTRGGWLFVECALCGRRYNAGRGGNGAGIAEQIILFHCLDDQAGLDAIDSQPYLSRKEKERSKHLYRICKDMDGLDRIRFNGLDYRLLRTEYGRKLPLVAGCLLNEDLLKALQIGRAHV